MHDDVERKRSKLESGGRPRLKGPYFDFAQLQAIETRAHRARAEYLSGLLRRLFDALVHSARRARERRIERYLAGSTDVVDLEQRMRALARREERLLG